MTHKAMVTDEMIEAGFNASRMGSRDSVRKVLEAALAQAETQPVATVGEMGVGGMRHLVPHPPGSVDLLPIGTPLYANRSCGGFASPIPAKREAGAEEKAEALIPLLSASAMTRTIKVPDGQTPLNGDLRHRLLDVFDEGRAARENGSRSPYHGHSLEHCLHVSGWVQQDLRMALDVLQQKGSAALSTSPTPADGEDTLPPVTHLEGLTAFAKAMIQVAFQGGDISGADIQELGVQHGLLSCVPFDPEKHKDPEGYAEEGDYWYVYAGPLATKEGSDNG